jgi:hypothetical protein
VTVPLIVHLGVLSHVRGQGLTFKCLAPVPVGPMGLSLEHTGLKAIISGPQ